MARNSCGIDELMAILTGRFTADLPAAARNIQFEQEALKQRLPAHSKMAPEGAILPTWVWAQLKVKTTV